MFTEVEGFNSYRTSMTSMNIYRMGDMMEYIYYPDLSVVQFVCQNHKSFEVFTATAYRSIPLNSGGISRVKMDY
jgi:hypothetical protein